MKTIIRALALLASFLIASPSFAAHLRAVASQCSGGAEVAAYSPDDQITPFLLISKDGQPRFLFCRDVALQVIDNINCLDHLIFATGDGASRLMATAFATDGKGVASVAILPASKDGYWGSLTAEETIVQTHATDEIVKDAGYAFRTKFGFLPSRNPDERAALQSSFELDGETPVRVDLPLDWPPYYVDSLSGAVQGAITVMGRCFLPFEGYDYSVIGYQDETQKPFPAVFEGQIEGVPEKPGIYRPVGSGKLLAPVRTFELAVAATSNACYDGKIYLFGAGRTAILSAKTNGREARSFSITPFEEGKTVPIGTTDPSRKED